MGEIVALVLLTAAGLGILSPVAASIPRVAFGAMAFPIGATVFAIVGSFQLVLIDRLEPVPAIAATVVLGIGSLGVGIGRGRVGGDAFATAGLTISAAGALAIIIWLVPLTRLTIDSMRYLISAFDLQLPDGVAGVQPADLLKRQLGLPAWQSLASLTERRYVAGVGPMFGASGTVLLGWLAWTATPSMSRSKRRLLTTAAVAFALGSNRYLFDWFYINTHVAMAVLVLIGVAGLWLATSCDDPAWALPAGLALAGALLLRAESPLVVALVLVAFAPEIRARTTRLLVAVPVITIGVFWYGLTLWSHAPAGSEIALDAPVLMGVVALTGSSAAVMLGGGRLASLVGLARTLLLPALALSVAVATVLEPSITIDSIVATARNIGYQGLWMFTWTIGVPLLAIALAVQRFRGGRAWSVIVAGYGLLFFLLPHLRESPWRLGSGDSGNRILAHIVLVAIVFLVLAATDEDGAAEVAAV